MSEWMNALQAGDEVVLYTGREMQLAKVERVTAKQVLVPYGRISLRFWKETGGEVGGDSLASAWGHSRWIKPYDAAAAEKLAVQLADNRRRDLAIKLRDFAWREQPLEVLERIVEMVEGAK